MLTRVIANGESVDEFGGSLLSSSNVASSTNPFSDFDAADFSSSHDENSHPDEVILPATSEHFNNVRGNGAPQRNGNSLGNQPNKAKAQNNMQAPARPNNGFQASNGSNRSNNIPPQPQTPNSGLSRSASGAGNSLQVRTAQETTDPMQGKREPQKFFAVRVGHVPGIYGTWAESMEQTANYPGAECKLEFPCISRFWFLHISKTREVLHVSVQNS